MTQDRQWQLARSSALKPGEVSHRQFWFEESLPEGARNVSRVYPPVTKLGVVMRGDAPWEGNSCVSTFCSSIVRLENGRYRLYYTVYPVGFKHMGIAIAESVDGLQWEKIPLGQYRHEGQDTNRIVFSNFEGNQGFVGQPQVLRLPDGRWRMYFWHHEKGYRYTIAHSPDGLQWSLDTPVQRTFVDSGLGGRGKIENGWMPDPALAAGEAKALWELKRLRTNDASYVYYHETQHRFEYYAQWLVPAIPDRRVDEDNCANAHRYIQRRFSQDGIAWSDPELVIMPDNRDPWDLQFYHLAMQWHEDWMIGSIGHYRVEADQQTQDLELVFSRDGSRWHRPLRGGFFPVGKDGETDCEGIYPPNAWVDEGATWLCLYTGTPLKHRHAGQKDPSKTTAVMGARWPKHRFLGLAAGRVPGGFLSDVCVPRTGEMTIDADIRGWLRAELCDVFGRKIQGYHLMQAEPVKGNGQAHVLRWKGRSTDGFRFDAVRVRFEFQDGEIYSMGC